MKQTKNIVKAISYLGLCTAIICTAQGCCKTKVNNNNDYTVNAADTQFERKIAV